MRSILDFCQARMMVWYLKRKQHLLFGHIFASASKSLYEVKLHVNHQKIFARKGNANYLFHHIKHNHYDYYDDYYN